MKHSIEQLAAVAYRYFPRGIPSDDPRYEQAPEMQRQREARIRAADQYPAWRDMLRRLDKRYPDAYIENQSIGLQARTGEGLIAASALGWSCPAETTTRGHRYLCFFVSFAVPYYVFNHLDTAASKDPDVQKAYDECFSFVLPDDAVPYAEVVAKEIERSFPDHQRMPAEVALTAVPEVAAGRHLYGEAVLFDCLFSDTW